MRVCWHHLSEIAKTIGRNIPCITEIWKDIRVKHSVMGSEYCYNYVMNILDLIMSTYTIVVCEEA